MRKVPIPHPQGPLPAQAAGGFTEVERGISGIFSFLDAPTVSYPERLWEKDGGDCQGV